MERNSWHAFRMGLLHAARYRWVLLVLFAVNLISALPLTVLPALGLASGMGQRPVIHQFADGLDAWLVVETLMAPVSDVALEIAGESESTRWLRQATMLGLITVLALPLVAWLPAAFVTGGLLLTYAEAPLSLPALETAPFRWRRFLWGCWRWFGVFLLLGVVQATISTALFVPIIGVAIGSIAFVGGWLAWIVVPLLVFLLVVWLALMEYIRIAAVVGQTRHMFQAFAKAVRFVFQNLPVVAGLYGLALLILGLLHASYRWGLLPHLPLDWWPVVLIVQQAFVLARLWARLVRLAGGMALYRALM